MRGGRQDFPEFQRGITPIVFFSFIFFEARGLAQLLSHRNYSSSSTERKVDSLLLLCLTVHPFINPLQISIASFDSPGLASQL